MIFFFKLVVLKNKTKTKPQLTQKAHYQDYHEFKHTHN